MMHYKPPAIIAALACIASSANARASGDQIFFAHGACTLLKIGSRDFTKICKGKFVSSTLANGRVLFSFMLGEDVLTFVGTGAKQTRLPAHHASQPIDRIRFASSDKASVSEKAIPAVGQCLYGDPFDRTAKVSCSVTGGQGLWVAEFVTDGSPPSIGP